MEKANKRRPWLKWAMGGMAVLVLAGTFVLFRGKPVRRQPADFAIEGSTFIALDKQKRELWRKDTGVEGLESEEFYRSNFQDLHREASNILPLLVMKDIDADGDTEVLFALKRHNDQTGEGLLVCYDRLGKERWRFRCDREIASRKKIFSPDYRIAGFFYHDFNGDGRQEIVVESFQAPDWPCQLALLDSSGKVIGEFWNAGYLRDLTYYDINGDGREELIVCGVNNEYQGGCLMVFDPRRISGGSPQTGDYVIKGLAPGSMLYYVTVPYLDVSAAAGDRVDGLRTVDITENHWIRSMTSKGLIYEFDFNLKCLQVSPGNGYVMQHDGQRAAGKLTSVLGEAYNERIREAIRYWNGSAFVAAPSMVVR